MILQQLVACLLLSALGAWAYAAPANPQPAAKPRPRSGAPAKKPDGDGRAEQLLATLEEAYGALACADPALGSAGLVRRLPDSARRVLAWQRYADPRI